LTSDGEALHACRNSGAPARRWGTRLGSWDKKAAGDAYVVQGEGRAAGRMRTISLQSGSNGNCFYVESEGMRLPGEGLSGVSRERDGG